ncbi:MAG: DUF393 domain-containing protein [Symploca sp. SIO1C2]|nr:DUF393 domain-containing protein [Symploca sp. SIO1C2]
MKYLVIYDGDCNLCTTFTKLLQQFDGGKLFAYSPMQDHENLKKWGITPQDCEMGMILLDDQTPPQKWQGSDAAEEITRLLPAGHLFINAYRAIPGMKWLGDRAYEQVRDNRYNWFGRRSSTYHAPEPFGCSLKEQQ